MVQMDITFIMHRTVEKWRTWYTEPMPNIGRRGGERGRERRGEESRGRSRGEERKGDREGKERRGK